MHPGVLASVVVASLLGGPETVLAGGADHAEETPASTLTAETVIPAASLREDMAVLKRALTQLHPGLFRYNDAASLERHFAALEASIGTDRSLRDAYLAFSRLTGAIRCGHTFASFWNQPKDLKAALFDGADKLPFTFRLVDRRMIVTANVSEDDRLGRGAEVLSIDEVPVAAILERLLPLVKADGSNDGKRLYSLQVTGQGQFEPFDSYHPLVLPPRGGAYRVEFRAAGGATPVGGAMRGITRAERKTRLASRHGVKETADDDLWEFRLLDDRTGYVRIGTFVTWNSKRDWKGFLRDAFAELGRKGVPNLVLDLRGNEGGADEVGAELVGYLVPRKVTVPANQTLLRYVRVAPDLLPHLDTWDKSFFDVTGRVTPGGNNFYALTGEGGAMTLKPNGRGYAGKVHLLVDAGDGSATFLLARLLKQERLATLVGQETGGNLRGTNGGWIAFLRLPRSRIAVDVPLKGYFPFDAQPDRGLTPDVVVPVSVEDVARGVDTELEAVRRMIAGEQSSPAAAEPAATCDPTRSGPSRRSR